MQSQRMNEKKWLLLFVLSVLLVAGGIAGCNWLADPMGVFGDRVYNWYSFDMTNNPRVAKIAYMDRHWEEYDSYIIGCSSTSSVPVEPFNQYLDARFYNMFMYGADMLDVEQTCRYMIENYTVKNLVLNVFLGHGDRYDAEDDRLTDNMHARADGSSLGEFYLRYLFMDPRYSWNKMRSARQDTYLAQTFDVFDAPTGTYDKKKRDAEPIGDLAAYTEKYPVFEHYPYPPLTMSETANTMRSVARIKALCDANAVNLIVIATPVYVNHWATFPLDGVTEFFTALAAITPFWDFSFSSVSTEPRYFYDETHFRNAVGTMAAARIFGDDSVYLPDDFGVYVTPENVAAHCAGWAQVSGDSSHYTESVPILLYHHIFEASGAPAGSLTAATFEEQIRALAEHGYTAIFLEDMVNYVEQGTPLPDKPVAITFDDGYASNYDYAWPILQKYDMKATIFAIGVSLGKTTYKDTGHAITPHFSREQAAEMVASGVISIQSHSYDMHQWPPFEPGRAREGALPLAGESEAAYRAAFTADLTRSRTELTAATGEPVYAYAYPYGYHSELSEALLHENGIRVTLIAEPKTNTLVKGLPQSLYQLGRMNVTGDMSGAELIARLEGGGV